jgi:hypothetical protein
MSDVDNIKFLEDNLDPTILRIAMAFILEGKKMEKGQPMPYLTPNGIHKATGLGRKTVLEGLEKMVSWNALCKSKPVVDADVEMQGRHVHYWPNLSGSRFWDITSVYDSIAKTEHKTHQAPGAEIEYKDQECNKS